MVNIKVRIEFFNVKMKESVSNLYFFYQDAGLPPPQELETFLPADGVNGTKK